MFALEHAHWGGTGPEATAPGANAIQDWNSPTLHSAVCESRAKALDKHSFYQLE